MHVRRAAGTAIGILVLLGASSAVLRTQSPPGARRIDDAALDRAGDRPAEWITHGGTYAETRYSPLARINARTVKDLGLAWSFGTESTRGLEATPLVVDGTLYTTASWSVVFALDAKTGQLKWKWDPEVPRTFGQKACCDVVNRGVALYNGKVYVGTLDGRLVALDAGTGKPVWDVVTVDQGKPYTITGAPRVVKGKVIIGNGGAEYGVRGYVSAYDAESGRLAWRFHTVPGDPSKGFESPAMERAAKTWTGEWWTLGGGGTVWDSLAYDPALDLLYVGTGNGSPWNRRIRSPGGGDNLYVSSILALRPATGELVWHYQTTPGESWDYTATQHMILADLVIEGRSRRVLMQAPKNGFFYVLDRETGALISAEPYTEVNWATRIDKATGRPMETDIARYQQATMIKPSPLGGHNWQPMSFNPQTGLVYIPAQDNWFGYADDQKFQIRENAWNTGVDFAMARGIPGQPRRTSSGYLLAWDPVAQKERWRAPYQHMWNGGTLTTAGQLVFQGTADGRFVAYKADTGDKLWELPAGSPIAAPPMTYEIDRVQYIAVMAAWGGSPGGVNPMGPAIVPGRLLVYALGGRQTLGTTTTSASGGARAKPEPIAVTAAADEIQAGATTYARRCSVCHGNDAVSAGVLPDLRYSAPSTFERYPDILLSGALAASGMPSFKETLSPSDLAAIRAYVLSRRAEIK